MSGPGRRGEAGFSIIELLVASCVGLLALVGVLYIYKAQSRGVVMQGSVGEMHLNAQFTLNEVMYYLAPAGLGLPEEMPGIDTSGKDLVVHTNSTKRSALASKDATFLTSGQVRYNLNAAGDTVLFRKKAYAVLQDNNGAVTQVKILKVIPKAGLLPAYLIFSGDKTKFPGNNTLYPLEKTRLHVATGAGADTVKGYFKVMGDNPFSRTPSMNLDSLALAEGIDSLGYRFHPRTGAPSDAFPSDLENLQAIEIIVRARTLIKDAALSGDGYRRETVRAKVNYKRSF